MSNKHHPLFELVSQLPVGSTLVNAVDEVDALADGVALNDSKAHFGLIRRLVLVLLLLWGLL